MGAGDALLVRSEKPNGHEPLAQLNLAVLENGPDLDRETLAAIAALMSALVGEVINLGGATVRAIGTVFPADRSQLIDRRLLVWESRHHLNEVFELLNHGVTLLLWHPSRRYYDPMSMGHTRI